MIREKDKDLPAPVVNALSQGNKIEAIKLLREANGIGLKEAKDVVEDYIKSQPELSIKLSAIQQETKKTLLRWVIILGALLLAIYWFFIRK
jgi:ribosomal protein L7/L12